MRVPGIVSILIIPVLVLMACATADKYDAKVQTWKGKDSESLVRFWGQPDSLEKLESGNRIFVYARLKRTPVAYNGAQRELASTPEHPQPNVYIKCSTFFEVNPQNIVTSIIFRGDECTSKD